MDINLAFGSSDNNVEFDVSAKRFNNVPNSLSTYSNTGVTHRSVTKSAAVETLVHRHIGEFLDGTRSPAEPGRSVTVNVSSTAKTVTFALKPTVIAREQRQERLNNLIRFGFTPPIRSTDK